MATRIGTTSVTASPSWTKATSATLRLVHGDDVYLPPVWTAQVGAADGGGGALSHGAAYPPPAGVSEAVPGGDYPARRDQRTGTGTVPAASVLDGQAGHGEQDREPVVTVRSVLAVRDRAGWRRRPRHGNDGYHEDDEKISDKPSQGGPSVRRSSGADHVPDRIIRSASTTSLSAAYLCCANLSDGFARERRTRMRVLVADDERLLANMVAEGLRRLSMAVDVVYDGDSRAGAARRSTGTTSPSSIGTCPAEPVTRCAGGSSSPVTAPGC